MQKQGTINKDQGTGISKQSGMKQPGNERVI